jgi:hypothetical protein
MALLLIYTHRHDSPTLYSRVWCRTIPGYADCILLWNDCRIYDCLISWSCTLLWKDCRISDCLISRSFNAGYHIARPSSTMRLLRIHHICHPGCLLPLICSLIARLPERAACPRMLDIASSFYSIVGPLSRYAWSRKEETWNHRYIKMVLPQPEALFS